MKKLSTTILLALIFALAACGNSEDATEPFTVASSNETSQTEAQESSPSESEAQSSDSQSQGPNIINTGIFKATLPKGWTNWEQEDLLSSQAGEIDKEVLWFVQGVFDSDVPMYTAPIVKMQYYKDAKIKHDASSLDNGKKISVTIGDKKFDGISGKDSSTKIPTTYFTLSFDGGAQIDVCIIGEKLNEKNADVQSILSSIAITSESDGTTESAAAETKGEVSKEMKALMSNYEKATDAYIKAFTKYSKDPSQPNMHAMTAAGSELQKVRDKAEETIEGVTSKADLDYYNQKVKELTEKIEKGIS